MTLLLCFSVLVFTRCKKDGDPDPIEITVVPELVSFELHPNRYLDNIVCRFTYNGIPYYFQAERPPGSEINGFAEIANEEVIPAGSTLTKLDPETIQVTNPSISNTISLTIDGEFIFVYGCGLTGGGGGPLPCDVKDFRKINLQITPATKFHVWGNSAFFRPAGFADTYISNLPGLAALIKKGVQNYNDGDRSATGSQPLRLRVRGSK